VFSTQHGIERAAAAADARGRSNSSRRGRLLHAEVKLCGLGDRAALSHGKQRAQSEPDDDSAERTTIGERVDPWLASCQFGTAIVLMAARLAR